MIRYFPCVNDVINQVKEFLYTHGIYGAAITQSRGTAMDFPMHCDDVISHLRNSLTGANQNKVIFTCDDCQASGNFQHKGSFVDIISGNCAEEKYNMLIENYSLSLNLD